MRWDRERGRWVSTPSDADSMASDPGPLDVGGSPDRVTEDAVVRIWERASGRPMTPGETDRARGHALVTWLRQFSEEDLSAAATAAVGQGGDLDWGEWRDAVRHAESATRTERPKPDKSTSVSKKRPTKHASKKRRRKADGARKSGTRFTNPDDTREIQTGSWKGRSPRAISDAELMKRLKKKYPNL